MLALWDTPFGENLFYNVDHRLSVPRTPTPFYLYIIYLQRGCAGAPAINGCYGRTFGAGTGGTGGVPMKH